MKRFIKRILTAAVVVALTSAAADNDLAAKPSKSVPKVNVPKPSPPPPVNVPKPSPPPVTIPSPPPVNVPTPTPGGTTVRTPAPGTGGIPVPYYPNVNLPGGGVRLPGFGDRGHTRPAPDTNPGGSTTPEIVVMPVGPITEVRPIVGTTPGRVIEPPVLTPIPGRVRPNPPGRAFEPPVETPPARDPPPINIVDPVRIDPIIGRIIPCPPKRDCRKQPFPWPVVVREVIGSIRCQGGVPSGSYPVSSEPIFESVPIAPVEAAPLGDAPAAAEMVDVEIVDLRFVDMGEGDKGPLLRVWVRNKGNVDIAKGFNLGVLVSTSRKMSAEAPKAIVRVESLKAGEESAIDVRLPKTAMDMGKNSEGKAVPFTFLFAVADSHEELKEKDTDNNLLVLPRLEIAMVESK